jgi:response regulator RpfG family c-di-GMP phosphodiesterase
VRIILTGYADLNATLDAINKGSVYRFLSKPWNDQELVMAVRQAVVQFDLLAENRRLHELTLAQNHELRDLNGNLEKKVEERTAETIRLHKDLEKSFLASVRALAGFTEMNSPHIGSHSRRVAVLSKAMAGLLGLPPVDTMQLEVAALLHDIGEIALSPEILRKPVALMKPAELQIWQKHVLQGDGVLRMVPHFEKAAKMVRHHHENYNGSGFPDRLKGENIPLGARIIAVADAYDSMLNSKADFQMATPEKALAWLAGHSAIEFDPVVAEALIASLKDESDKTESDEVEVSLSDLREGMVLSRDVHTPQGMLLLLRGTALSAKHLNRIASLLSTDQIEAGDVFIRRTAPQVPAESPSRPAAAPDGR